MATLKISDLSVGDWVSYNGRDYQVKSIHGDFERVTLIGNKEQRDESIYAIQPIPITAEMLEANGLYRHEADADNPKSVVMSNSCMLAKTYEDVDWWRVLIYDEEELSAELFNGIVYSVHQLQHALRLAGIDKEIVMPNK